MTDTRLFGVCVLLSLSALIIGFIMGWCANPDDDHD